jgi:hypothetical protein
MHKFPGVMAALEAAIQRHVLGFGMQMDGRVKPGHDHGGGGRSWA